MPVPFIPFLIYITNHWENMPAEIVFPANDRIQQENPVAQFKGDWDFAAPAGDAWAVVPIAMEVIGRLLPRSRRVRTIRSESSADWCGYCGRIGFVKRQSRSNRDTPLFGRRISCRES